MLPEMENHWSFSRVDAVSTEAGATRMWMAAGETRVFGVARIGVAVSVEFSVEFSSVWRC